MPVAAQSRESSALPLRGPNRAAHPGGNESLGTCRDPHAGRHPPAPPPLTSAQLLWAHRKPQPAAAGTEESVNNGQGSDVGKVAAGESTGGSAAEGKGRRREGRSTSEAVRRRKGRGGQRQTATREPLPPSAPPAGRVLASCRRWAAPRRFRRGRGAAGRRRLSLLVTGRGRRLAAGQGCACAGGRREGGCGRCLCACAVAPGGCPGRAGSEHARCGRQRTGVRGVQSVGWNVLRWPAASWSVGR